MSLSPHLDWDHLRIFLGMMRATSLRQAAENLRVSHPTIRRRIAALEEELGLRLFDRRRDGLHATPEAAELLALAEQVETSIHALGRRALDADPELRGPVRVTAPEIVVTELLVPAIAAFEAKWPQIELEIDLSYDVANLDQREADVAIRAMSHGKSPQDNVAGRLAAVGYGAVYGENDAQWIGWYGGDRDLEWIAKTPFSGRPARGRYPNPSLQREACARGMGLTLLPCFYAEPRLVRRCEPFPHTDIWVLVHPDLRRSPRLRIFRDEMVTALKGLKPRLEGKPKKTAVPAKRKGRKKASGKKR